MKKIFFVLMFLVLSNARAQNFGELKSDQKFSEQGSTKLVDGKLVEEGELKDVAYRFYYSDSGGTFNAATTTWNVHCTKDPMTDLKACFMSTGDMLIALFPKGVTSVDIGANNFPGSSISIRIDGGKPISAAKGGPFSSRASADIVKKLMSAKTVATRYMEWPYQVWDDKSFDLNGFKETYSYLQWAIARIK